MWKVGFVQMMNVPGEADSWGFNLTTERGKPLVVFAYASVAEAKAAATQVRAAVANAILVRPQPQ